MKWIDFSKGLVAILGAIATLVFLPTAVWIVSSSAQSQRRLDVLEERTRDIGEIREMLHEIRSDISAIRSRNEGRDEMLDRRLDHIEEGLGLP